MGIGADPLYEWLRWCSNERGNLERSFRSMLRDRLICLWSRDVLAHLGLVVQPGKEALQAGKHSGRDNSAESTRCGKW